MTGLSLGRVAAVLFLCYMAHPRYRSLIGPVVGGVLYNRFGFRGPGICAIIVTILDLVGRLLIIERKDAVKYGVDPAAEPGVEGPAAVEVIDNSEPIKKDDDSAPTIPDVEPGQLVKTPHLTFMGVMKLLAKSPRALTVMFCTLIYGLVAMADPSCSSLTFVTESHMRA